MVAAAVIGGAVISAGAGIYSSSQAANASSKGAEQVRADTAPYRQGGIDALNRINNPNDLLKNFQTSPGYQFRLDQGLNAVGTNKATNGLLKSGSTIKAFNNYAQNFASNDFNTWWNQQKGLVDTGASATAGVNTSTMVNAANQGNAAIAQGNTLGDFAGQLGGIYSKYGIPEFGAGASGPGGTSSYTAAGYSDLPVVA